MPIERTALHVPLGAGLTPQETLDLIRRAEELGYESVWCGESWGGDAFTPLAWAAARTSRIGLGTHVATIFSRTPAMTAQSAASLDALSGGRLTLGLGTSGPIVVQDWHGQRWERPLRRTREYVEIVRLILSGERVDYDGELFRLRGFRLRDVPPSPEMRVFVAAIGPRNVALTGEVADGWLPIFLSRDTIPEMQAQLAAGAARSGRDASALEIAPSVLAAASDADAAAARGLVRAHVAYYVGGMGSFYREMMRRSGYEEEAERIRAEWARPARAGRESAAEAVTDAIVDATGAAGSASHAREMLAASRAAGVTLPILMFPHGADKALMRDTLEALAPSRPGARRSP